MLSVDKQIEIQQSNDIKSILETEYGRRFMWRILCYCGIYRDVEGDHDDMMKQLGRRQVGLYLMGILSDIDDESVFKMMKEAKNRDMEEAYARRIEQDKLDRDSDEYGSDSHDYDSRNALSDYL